MITTNDIFAQISLTQNVITEIQSRFFEVVKLPLTTGIAGFENPDTFGVYKSIGGKALSTMGKDFLPMQQQEFLDNIVETVHEFGADLDLDTLQFKEFSEGKRIEFSLKMHPISFKNNKGLQDITNLELTFATSYDGSKSSTISLYTERLVCTNGMVAKGLEGVLKGRNTIGGKAKILSYSKEVAKLVNQTQAFKEKMIALDKRTVSKTEIEKFKLQLLGYNSESLLAEEKSTTRKENILEALECSFDIEFERTGQTAFGLLQGVTHYTNHIANTSKTITDAEYIRFYNGAKLNDLAQKLTFELVN